MRQPFNNQVVLITGAGSGIGRQLALEMARQGGIIAAIDLQPESLETLITELKARNLAGGWEIADVTDRTGLRRAIDSLTKRVGPIEILIANAGIGIPMPALEFRAEDLEAQVSVNLVGVANTIEAVLPGMLERKRGHLVAISSLASYRGVPLLAGYSASKAGVNGMMDCLRLELKSHGIVCTTICPGFIRTPMLERLLKWTREWRQAPIAIHNVLEVEDAARRIVRAIEKRKPLYAFPWQTAMLLGFGKFLPVRMSDWLVRMMMKKLGR
jgi:short-subunit dehydrogenase